MIAPARQDEWPLRLVAALLTVGGLALCYVLPWPPGRDAAAPVFFLVMAVCGTLVLLVRGVGTRRGMVLGLLTGFVAAMGLARQYATPTGNLVAFVTIATTIMGFLGYLAGGWASFVIRRAEPRCAQAQDTDDGVGRVCDRSADMPAQGRGHATPGGHGTSCTASDRRSGQPQAGGLVEEVLGGIVGEFCDWVESDAGRQCCTEASDWSGFDQFLRTTLREQLGAAGVRAFRVSSDGQRLEPLTRHAGSPEQWPSTRTGLIGHVVTSGQVYVAGDPDQGAFIADLAEPGEPQRWIWLLPLRADKCTCGLVAVQRIDKPACRGMAVANAVRNQLQLFWAHLAGLQVLGHHIRTDCQSGVLRRTELLSQLDEVVGTSVREGEPVMVLALAIEGLRHLDDTGQWSQRDTLVQRLGSALRHKVRSDDLLGRFSDDRFIIVLRRLDSALGTLVAEKLIETVRTTALAALENHTAQIAGRGGAGSALRLRAGLAGTGVQGAERAARPFATFAETLQPPDKDAARAPEATDGRALLERALALLDYAREQRIEIATDLMKGLPPQLERSAGGGGPPTPQPAPASAPPVTPAVPAGPAAETAPPSDTSSAGPFDSAQGRPPSPASATPPTTGESAS